MKDFLKYSLISIFLIAGFSTTGTAWADWFGNSTPDIYICRGEECGLEQGVTAVEDTLNNVETESTLSEYIIDTTLVVGTFLSLIAVLVIFYAGFMILTSSGDEEKLKTARKMIFYAILGILLIWFAYSIMDWLETALNDEFPTG